ncbi:MAG: uroporphyrinogen-III C-methyltransferase, partial [Verrucomicrobiota bacterium]
MSGKVYLVGAGPGDLGLVTLRAQELIKTCDVLVYDYLANPELRRWTKSDCEHYYVGKRPNLHAIPQSEIEAILVEHARAGKQVVRLKGGDPFVFGRGGEEACRLQADGIPFEIVPGVTAAFASAACTGIPLTHRDHSSSISFLTGHEDPEKHLMHVDFEQFAKVGGTLCIYMGMGHLEDIVRRLTDGGLSPNTPVAIVEWASLPRQRSLLATLETVVTQKEKLSLQAPAVIIVGEVAQYYEKINWFEARPLFGKRVAITRARQQASELKERLLDQGAEVLELPLIEIVEEEAHEVADIFDEIATYNWIIFTSPNGARFFFKKFHRAFSDLRCIGGARLACIGKSTAREVERQHLAVDLVPETATAEHLADTIMAEETLDSLSILVVTGNRNRDTLVRKLEDEGHAIVDLLPVYRNQPTDLSEEPGAVSFREHGADAIVFTSASTVE